jgi:hypothetical protein
MTEALAEVLNLTVLIDGTLEVAHPHSVHVVSSMLDL